MLPAFVIMLPAFAFITFAVQSSKTSYTQRQEKNE